MQRRNINLWQYVCEGFTAQQKKDVKLIASECLDKLKPKYKELIEHRYNLKNGSVKLPYRDIAGIMGVTYQNVQLTNNRSLSKFRSTIRQYYFNKSALTTPESVEPVNIEDLGLSARARNGLNSAGITTVGELIRTSRRNVMKIKHFGMKSMREVEDLLASIGLCFSGEQGIKN